MFPAISSQISTFVILAILHHPVHVVQIQQVPDVHHVRALNVRTELRALEIIQFKRLLRVRGFQTFQRLRTVLCIDNTDGFDTVLKLANSLSVS